MDDVAAHRGESRPGFFEIGGIATDHDRKRTGNGAANPTRDRRIEKSHPALLESGGDPLRSAGIDRRHFDAEPPGRGGFDDTGKAEIDSLDIGRGGQHRNHQVALCGRLAHRTRPLRAQLCRSVERRRDDILGERFEFFPDEVGQHRLPHCPGSDKPNLHALLPSKPLWPCCRGSRSALPIAECPIQMLVVQPQQLARRHRSAEHANAMITPFYSAQQDTPK